MNIVLVLLLALIAGCSPQIVREPYEVKVQVKIPCRIVAPEKPIMPFETSPLGEDIYTKVQKLAAEIKLRKAYELKLEAAIQECNK